jgi:hypothetical protein
MSATPPVGTPGTMSVKNLIASMQRDMTKAPPPPPPATTDLQGTPLMDYEEQISGPSPAVKVEREGGLGTFGLPGGGYQWCAIGASLSGKCTRILFGSNLACQALLVAGVNV